MYSLKTVSCVRCNTLKSLLHVASLMDKYQNVNNNYNNIHIFLIIITKVLLP